MRKRAGWAGRAGWAPLCQSSIDNRINEPSPRVAIEKNAIHGAVAQRNVPFVAVPTGQVGRVHPPVPRRAPWAGTSDDAATGKPTTIGRDAYRLAAGQRDARRYRLAAS